MQSATRRRSIALIGVLALTATSLVAQSINAPGAHAVSVSSTDQTNAQAMLNSGRLSFSHPEPEAQIYAYAGGSQRINPGTGRPCQINSVLLGALRQIVVERGFTIRIGSLNRWCEEQSAPPYTSYHWVNGGGHAVDVNLINGSGPQSQAARTYIAAMGSVLPLPTLLGQPSCWPGITLPAGWGVVPDNCEAVHIEYRGPNGPAPAPGFMFSLTSGGWLEGKYGLPDNVNVVASNAVRADADGETIAIVDSDGTAWGKVGYYSGWEALAYNIADVKVDGERFVLLDRNGDVYAKNDLHAAQWTYLTYAATAIEADNDRIGVLGTDKRVYVKQGFYGDWVPLADNVTNFSLGGNRIGVIANGTGSAKEGTIYAPWVAMTNGTQIDVTTDRVAVRDGTALHVKVGNLQQPWTWNVAQNLRDVDIEGDRVLVTDTVGDVYFKQGVITASWVKVFVNGLTADLN